MIEFIIVLYGYDVPDGRTSYTELDAITEDKIYCQDKGDVGTKRNNHTSMHLKEQNYRCSCVGDMHAFQSNLVPDTPQDVVNMGQS